MKSEKEKLIKKLYEGCKDIKVDKSNDFKCETPIAKVIKICEENKKEIEKQIKRSLVFDECIYKLQEEKDQLQKRFNDYQDRKIKENADLIKRLDIADKKLTVFSRELEQANKENERLREINHELAKEHKIIGQDLYAEIKDYREEKEKLKQQLEIDKNQINYFIEENEKLKTQIKQLEDFIKSDDEIDYINHEYTYKLKKILQDIKTLVTTDYIQNKKQLVQNYDCLDNFMQKIEDKCGEVL